MYFAIINIITFWTQKHFLESEVLGSPIIDGLEINMTFKIGERYNTVEWSKIRNNTAPWVKQYRKKEDQLNKWRIIWGLTGFVLNWKDVVV